MLNLRIFILLAFLGGLFGLVTLPVGCAKQPGGTQLEAQLELDEYEADPAVWGRKYPRHYDTYLRNNEVSRTEYGGSDKYSKLEREPAIRTLFAGMGFSKEYNEDRGHTYALEDIRMIDPKRKSVGTCITCKTSDFKRLYHEMGEAYATQPIQDNINKSKHPVSCLDCHEPKTNQLVITRPALKEAFQRQGRDITKATRQEMRSLVCAQCHVEYYFVPENKKLTFPWDSGVKADEMYKYYESIGFTDWTHPDTGAKMLKAQHPDYELNIGGTHFVNGVSCADCHMPYMTVGNQKISSHWMTSPLKHINESCGACHRQGENVLKERVLYTQRRVYDQMIKAQEGVVALINAIKISAGTPGVDTTKLDEARRLHRQSQWYVDFISSENSMGFHNPQEALRLMAESQRLSGEGRIRALEAATGRALPPTPTPTSPGMNQTPEDKQKPPGSTSQ